LADPALGFYWRLHVRMAMPGWSQKPFIFPSARGWFMNATNYRPSAAEGCAF